MRQCDTSHGADDTKLMDDYDYWTLDTIPYLATYAQCNIAFRECNDDCLEDHNIWMEKWPKPGTTWETWTSSKLSTCILVCNAEAAVDHLLLRHSTDTKPENFNDVDFAFCNAHISKCTRECQVPFNEEVRTFQHRNDD
jgi:hypothetical protein